ncbi:hypothetical protein L905_06060 [Agrobacterium sp. TS43]|nr:hypothetical protein L905_06060 [Agrobacterium sp. TS43]
MKGEHITSPVLAKLIFLKAPLFQINDLVDAA